VNHQYPSLTNRTKNKTMLMQNKCFLVTVILITGLAIRLLFAFIAPSNQLKMPADSFYYNEIAENLFSGKGYHEGNLVAYRPPLYNSFLALIYFFWGNFSNRYYMVVLIQSILSMATCYFLYLL
jgi:hypothetical protein